MDGTLIDSKKDITISINYVRKINHDLEPLSEAYIVEAINMEVRNLPKLFYNTDEYLEKDRDVFEVHYKTQCVENPYLYDGVKDMLEELKANGVLLSVATNAPTQFAKRILTHLQVADLFDVIIGADKVNASKPDPSMLYEILHYYNYNVSFDKAWMIGDNSKDMQSAKNAQIEGVFATWGFSPKSSYKIRIQEPKEIFSIVL